MPCKTPRQNFHLAQIWGWKFKVVIMAKGNKQVMLQYVKNLQSSTQANAIFHCQRLLKKDRWVTEKTLRREGETGLNPPPWFVLFQLALAETLPENGKKKSRFYELGFVFIVVVFIPISYDNILHSSYVWGRNNHKCSLLCEHE